MINILKKNYMKNEYDNKEDLLQKFNNELLNVCKGLEKLKLTYRNDVNICIKIKMLIEKIETKIKKIK